MKCVVCGAVNWRAIPDAADNRAITTAAIIVDCSVAKSQCMDCGFAVRTGHEFLAKTDYYEERYADYYRRPGALVYDAHRYVAMSNWMKAALGEFQPKNILDVGCGAGWSMAQVRNAFGGAEIEGSEPSKANSAIARAGGFTVHNFKAGEGTLAGRKFDLIYSHNVLTHVNEPVAFLSGLKDMLADGGRIVQITVDGTVPSNELLWCDHNFSFLPAHILKIAERAGLVVVHHERNPDDVTILNKQLVVFAAQGSDDRTVEQVRSEPVDIGELYARRVAYTGDWRALNNDLKEKLAGYRRVVNFGSSMWTWLLAGFCPDYWDRVSFCTVDGFSGRCVDRDVAEFAKIEWQVGDCLVLGVNPRSQSGLKTRFQDQPFDVVTWNDRVQI